MIPEKWTKESYREYIKYLKSISEIKYRDFTSKLMNSKYEVLGIRIPLLRKIGKGIYKNSNYNKYLSLTSDKYFEDILVEGQVIANIKDEKEFYEYFMRYIYKIDDWSLCDTFCNSIKIVKKYKEKYFNLALDLCLSEEEYISRVGQIMILNHFVTEENLKDIFKMIDSIKSDKYYVNMATAWLICELYIKYPQETRIYILNSKVNKFTFNKAISKINDSYRVSDDDKKYLNTLKRK